MVTDEANSGDIDDALSFDTGKLIEVARRKRIDRGREYGLLFMILGVSLVPYVVFFIQYPFATTCVVFFMGYFQVLLAFGTSANTDTAHHIRFLLCGSNPIGMTGASSLLFGSVDSVIDWREDQGERRRQPLKYWLLTIYKLLMTPVGGLLMLLEFMWDGCLMLRPRLIRLKWAELFSLAYYHDLVCPEKSNDIFYADLANARFRNDVHLYQWNRMRAMVFELKHYAIDAENGVGVAESNIFLQDEISAYQTIKRLRIESIEQQLDEYYGTHIDRFPIPASLARQLIKNAQPIRHYLSMRRKISRYEAADLASNTLSELVEVGSNRSYAVWHVLRLLDANQDRFNASHSRYITDETLRSMHADGILAQVAPDEFQFDASFLRRFEYFLKQYFVPASQEQQQLILLQRIPRLVFFRGAAFKLASDA